MPEVIHIDMLRENLENIPQYSLPEGFSIRTFKKGEGLIWAGISAAAGNFGSPEEGLDRFNKEFSEPVADMESRCFFVVHNESNREIGTAMAWYEPAVDGESIGRVHWVSIHPDFQGKGLAKPMMTAVLNRLAQSHEKAILGTQTFRKTAVRLYLDLGFVPLYQNPTCEQAWKDLANEINHPALEAYRQ